MIRTFCDRCLVELHSPNRFSPPTDQGRKISPDIQRIVNPYSAHDLVVCSRCRQELLTQFDAWWTKGRG